MPDMNRIESAVQQVAWHINNSLLCVSPRVLDQYLRNQLLEEEVGEAWEMLVDRGIVKVLGS